MILNFNNRLKDYLINLIVREGDSDAWELLKTRNPTCAELDRVIRNSPFIDEAWELFKMQSPTMDQVISVIYSDKKKEAISFLLQNYQPENERLVRLIRDNRNDDLARYLLLQDPTQQQLHCILDYTSLADEAAEILLKQPLENGDLVSVIGKSNLKDEAWERLLKQNPTNKELILIISHSTKEEERAWEQLLKQEPTNEELMDLVNDYSGKGRKRIEATKLILQQDPDIETLIHIIDNDQLADEAFELLKSKSPNSEDLGWLIWRANIKVNEAAELSLKSNPTKQQLLEILENSDLHEEAAKILVEIPLEISELAHIVLVSNNEKALELLSERVKFERTKIDEQIFVRELAEKIINNPELLDVNNWHNGDKHCFGGWAIAQNEAAQKVEKEFSSEIAAILLLPSYTHLFFADRETVLEALKKV